MMDFAHIFAALVFAHALGDYPLQGDFLSKAKNRFTPVPNVPWYQAMGAHAVIHGGLVGIITGSLVLAIAETAVHFYIDDSKCAGVISYNQDQALHISWKAAWAVLAAWMLT